MRSAVNRLLLLALVFLVVATVEAKKKFKKNELPSEAVLIPEGNYKIGGCEKSGAPWLKNVTLKSYYIDTTTVTNAQFRAFVRKTKFKTESEVFQWSFVLDNLATEEVKATKPQSVDNAPQWLAVMGAYWRKPEGAGSNIKEREDHPVVHISWNDAKAYCKWAGKRLPSEAEWEVGARSGVVPSVESLNLYPWKEANDPEAGKINVWQGKFPKENTEEDGFLGQAPAKQFKPNPKGLFNTVGNVWEWTKTRFYQPKDPKAPKEEKPQEQGTQYVLKGGSYLDTLDGTHNHKATVATRMGNTPDSGGGNTGFRCAKTEGAKRIKKKKNKAGVEEKIDLDDVDDLTMMPKSAVDQNILQQVIADHGVEGLQKFMSDSGMGGSVTTPAELQKIQEAKKKHMEEL